MSNYKVYLFYLISTGELYAFTINKNYKDKFLSQRNPKCFKLKRMKMSTIQYKVFSNKYNLKMMEEIPLNSSLEDYLMIVSTREEEYKMMEEGNRIDIIMETASKVLTNIENIKPKYKKSIEYISNTTYLKSKNDGTKDLLSRINLLFLFSKLFRNTFVVNEEDIDS